MMTKKPMSEEQRLRKNQKSRERYRQNKERIAQYHAEHYRKKSQDPEFKKMMAEKSAIYRKTNPDYVKQANKNRRLKNPEQERERCRKWFSLNPEKRVIYEQNRRAKKKANGGKLSPLIREKLFELQMGKCACCKAKVNLRNMHLDHVMPISKGGSHTDDNVQLLCQPCNQSKYAKHPIDFMQEMGFLL